MPNRLRKISGKNFAIGGALMCLILISMTVLQVSTAAAQQLPSGPQSRKPNILIIMTDDQPINMMGYEGNAAIKTPNLDALAKAGIIVDRMYVPIGLCAPVRASFITGLWPHRHGLTRNWVSWRMPDNLTFLPAIFRDNGYDTALIGKCHFDQGCHDPDPAAELEANPQTQAKPVDYRKLGFKYADIIHDLSSDYYDFMHADPNKSEKIKGKYVTDYTTDLALQYLRRQETATQPFLLWLAYNAPHEPWTEQNLPPEFKRQLGGEKPLPPITALDNSADENINSKSTWQQKLSFHAQFLKSPQEAYKSRQVAAAMIENLDDNVGKIIDQLKRSGQLDSTIIVFLSDNGVFLGEHQLISKGPYGYEEQIRVPAFIVSPMLSDSTGHLERPVSSMDIFPTLMRLANLPNPAFQIDGRSFDRLLMGFDDPNYRDAISFEYYINGRHYADSSPLRGIVTQRWKWVHFFPGQSQGIKLLEDEYELYDLSKDPKEQNNLFADAQGRKRTLDEMLADPRLGPIMMDLRRAMARIMSEGDDPLRPRIMDVRDRRLHGSNQRDKIQVFWQTPMPAWSEFRIRESRCQACSWTSVLGTSMTASHNLVQKNLDLNKSYDVEIYAYDKSGNGDYAHWTSLPGE